MTRPSQIKAAETQRMVLRETLRLAVPMHMRELADMPVDRLLAMAAECADVIGSQGDVLQFIGHKRGETAEAFNALARGLAVAALVADGGVDFIGLHWCSTAGCPAASRFEHADDTEPAGWPEPPEPPPPRAIETLPDLAGWPA